MTLSIRVELLTGRYTAARFDDRETVEWPPHPARLFSALVDTWADADDPDPDERAVLAWLEQQPPPSLTCSRPDVDPGAEDADDAVDDGVAYREVPTHFVPSNDVTSLARDVSASYLRIGRAMQELDEARRDGTPRTVATAQRRLDQAWSKARDDAARAASPTGRESGTVADAAVRVLPEHRVRQPRSFPTVVPNTARFWFTWPDAVPNTDQRTVLAGLLARLGRLGHSSTLVACDLQDRQRKPMLVPYVGGSDGSHGLRVPVAGALEELEADFAVHRGTEPRTGPYPTLGYGRPAPTGLPRPQLGGDWLVLGLPAGGARLSLPSTLWLTRTVRNAIIRHAPKPVPSVLSGHEDTPSGETDEGKGGDTRPLAEAHLAIVPLAHVGHRHADGRVLGVALALPASAGEAERQALEAAVSAWQVANDLTVYTQQRRLTLTRVGWNPGWEQTGKVASLSRSYWSRASRRWVSVTPVALDRHPGLLTHNRPEHWEKAVAHATETITRSCRLTGLPEPTWVGIRLDAPLTAVPATPGRRRPSFPAYRTRGGKPRIGVHVELEFDQSVAGPVLLGAGRFLGYGLFLPREHHQKQHQNDDDREGRGWTAAS